MAIKRKRVNWIFDLDLKSVFDRVSHDQLMARIETRAGDRRLLKLILAFLKAGVMEGGLVSPVDEGTPQGGPLSPLLRKYRARRVRPGVGAERSPVCAVRGRPPHLRSQPAGRGASDGEY
ncbi:MAG: reverse transcriptase domain-containing protein [Bryobacteraceae bacterium]